MRSKTALLLLTVIVASLLFFPGATKATPEREYIVAAYDEEFGEHGYMLYAPGGGVVPIGAEDYIEWQLERAFYHFNLWFSKYIEFELLGLVTWDSDDTLNLEEMLFEARTETGYDDGLYINGIKATVLIAFTFQHHEGENNGGGCLPEPQALIIRHQEEWADDNVILHELSHLWVEHHCYNECLVSYAYEYMGFYDEPLAPGHGHVTLFIGTTEHWSYFAYEWCDQCKDIIVNDLGYEPPNVCCGWGGSKHWKKIEGLRGPGDAYYILVAFWIVLIASLLLLVGYALCKRFYKPKTAVDMK